MKLPETIELYWNSLQTQWSRVKHKLDPNHPNTMLELFRPNLRNTPTPAKRFLEPMIASISIIALFLLSALAVGNFTMLLACSGLAYALLTEVFGIEIDLNLPPGVRF